MKEVSRVIKIMKAIAFAISYIIFLNLTKVICLLKIYSLVLMYLRNGLNGMKVVI